MLFPIVWEAIRQLESIGFKVICVTGDGASKNRKFFRLHGTGDSFTYKTHNSFANPEKKSMLYFKFDPLHLIKAAKNCWSHSGTWLMSVSTSI